MSCDVAATGRTCDFAQGMEVEQVMKPRVSLGSLDKERWLKKYLNYVCILSGEFKDNFIFKCMGKNDPM